MNLLKLWDHLIFTIEERRFNICCKRKRFSFMSKKNSRTQNTLFNFTSSLGGVCIMLVMQFVVQTVFINTLGKSYLGINGLFTNILSMLSLTEFGVGSAILFKLYEPISKEDHHRIVLLMKFYKNVYRIIGTVIALIGLGVIPFLPYLMKDYDKLVSLNLNAAFIFVLFLVKTVSSYVFFAYKSAIINANQKEYLINLISYLFTICGGIVQIVFLLIYPKFEIYVIISVLQVLLQNVAIAVLANKMYPYITERTKEKIERKEIIEVVKDCSAIFLYKLNSVVLKATDNIVLSVFIGLEMVGMYSNYYVFYTTINSLCSRIFGSVSHSLGNLHTTHDNKHEYQVFEVVNLITAILGGTAFVGVFVVADEFVLSWIGQKWLIPQPFSLLMGLELYTLASRVAISKYRSTMGLFQQAKWRPLAGIVINLAVSIVLVNLWGICGVLVGTIVADWTTFMWFDPMIIHKYGFNGYKSVTSYYKRLAFYTVVVVAVGAFDYIICQNFFTGHGWLSVIVHAMICAITVPSTLIFLMRNKHEGRYVMNLFKKNVQMVRKKFLG